MSGSVTMSGQLYMTFTEATSKTIVQKVQFLTPPPSETPEDIDTKRGDQPTPETELYHRAIFHAHQRQIFVPRQKIHIESPRRADFKL